MSPPVLAAAVSSPLLEAGVYRDQVSAIAAYRGPVSVAVFWKEWVSAVAAYKELVSAAAVSPPVSAAAVLNGLPGGELVAVGFPVSEWISGLVQAEGYAHLESVAAGCLAWGCEEAVGGSELQLHTTEPTV